MGKKIKVLHISKRFPPYIGGIETVCYDICRCLMETGEYEQRVIAFNDNKKTIRENYNGIDVTRVGVNFTLSSQPVCFEYGKVLKQMIQEFQPDIIHFQYPNPFAAYYFLKNKFNGKFILQWNCDIIKQKFLMKFFVKQNLKLLERANIVAAISPKYFENTDYLPNYHGNKTYLPCCIGEDRMNVTEDQIKKVNEIKSKYKNKKICFFFGRHVPYKGLEYLIRANEFLDRTKVQILIGGKGPLTNELKEESKKYDNIEFLGVIKNEDINAYLMACDIFTFPSITRNEAFGISLAEAMYFGKPACTFTILGSGVNRVSLDGVTGLEAPNKNVIEYAKNIMKLVEDNELYLKLSNNAKKRCDDLFTFDSFKNNVYQIYKGLN